MAQFLREHCSKEKIFNLYIMKKFYGIIVLSLLLMSSCGKGVSLPRDLVRDTAQYDSVFFDVARTACNELHAFMVVKDGKVIYEKWDPSYGPDHLHVMWSASKTFTATAVGFAVQDGLLNVTDKVVDYFTEEELPAVQSDWLRKMTIYDLLIMSSGFKDDCVGKAESGRRFDWAKETLSSEILFEPGTRFSYNSMNTYLLSVIVSRVTGERLDEYLDKKLFKPLGITEYRWKISPQNYAAGGWGLYMRTEDFAKMGLFMLQKGQWKRKRLLNEEWFDAAMIGTIGLAYELSSDGTYATCTGIGTATDTDIVIASKYEGFPVTSIGTTAFKNNRNLTSVVIGDGVTSIGYSAFNDCRNLTSVVIGVGVTSIDRYVFNDCRNLTSIDIPSGVTSIGDGSFQLCSNLKRVDFSNHTSIPTIGSNVFSSTSSTLQIKVPANLETTWESATNWSNYADKIVTEFTNTI